MKPRHQEASAAIVLFAALVLAFACSGNGKNDNNDVPVPGECADRDECDEGMICLDGYCTHCSRDRDCLEYEQCDPVRLICVPLDDWGLDCDTHDECALGEFCVQGLCRSGDEVTPCANDAECPAGRYCNMDRLVCEEDLGCFDDSRCPEDYYCNTGTGRCERSCTEETAEELCPEGFICHGGRCVECVEDDDCGAGLTCDPDAGRCRGEDHCFSDRDCLRPLVCNRKTGQCTEQPPPCVSNQDCITGEACELRSGRCVSKDCVPDAFEPNGTMEEAAEIGPGLYSNLTLCGDEEDWFTTPLDAGDSISVTVSPPALGGSNYSVVLLSPGGERVLAHGNLQVDSTVDREGDYLIRVSTLDSRSTYGLQVLVSRGRPCDDDYLEPNDDVTEAAEIYEGAWYNLKKCPGNDDWFVVPHERGTTVQVTLVHEPLDGALDLVAYDSDGITLIAESATTEPVEIVVVDETSAGRFYIEVVGGRRVQNSYDLFVETWTQ